MAEGSSISNSSKLSTEEISIETVLSESKRDLVPVGSGRHDIAKLVGFSDGRPQVDISGSVRLARLCGRLKTTLSREHIGRDVLLLLSGHEPVIIDVVEDQVEQPLDAIETTIDGRRIQIEARDEVVLRCGEASITLRRNGRVVIRGAYVETRAKGTNRIKGGSVQIN